MVLKSKEAIKYEQYDCNFEFGGAKAIICETIKDFNFGFSSFSTKLLTYFSVDQWIKNDFKVVHKSVKIL